MKKKMERERREKESGGRPVKLDASGLRGCGPCGRASGITPRRFEWPPTALRRRAGLEVT